MKRSVFSLSHHKLLSFDMGELVPIGMTEVLPGDTMQQATTMLVRASPLLAPVMHPVDVRIHHWFVPHRLVWADFEKFITGGPDGLDASVFPTITFGGAIPAGTVMDYLGMPLGVAGLTVSALPFRAYNLIWNNWYRDQDLETALAVSTASGNDVTTNTNLKSCSWEKDYFTSARPWEQKGPTVTVPLGTTAPVMGLGFANTPSQMAASTVMRQTTPVANETVNNPPWWMITNAANTMGVKADSAASGTTKPSVFADLTNASAVTVNTLRQALAFQRYEEARARFGSRYIEYLRYLGVKSSDGRLQVPEYLGGGRDTIQFSEILQTAADGTNPVGTMRGHGIAGMRSNRYRRFFEEHGYVMSLASVRPKTMYMQGLARTWNRRVKEDFWQKELQFIGQQAIKNKELYAAHASPDGTFGYQDRYDEYRRSESSVSGEFRTVLNFWHFAREFGSSPALNGTFVSCVPTERTFAVSTNDVLWVMAKHSIQARRLVAKTGRSMTF
ncbi:MAG: major capsid protein [Microviridae sp. ctQch27]|nr:MAG: major capsid protein [Microviridae sp. ctQch27]